MSKRLQIDRRVVTCFLILMLTMNAMVLFIPWNDMMAGKNDFPVFYSLAQMVREGQASHLYDFDAENSFVYRVSHVARAPNNHLPYELLIFVPLTYLEFSTAHVLWTLLSLGMLVVVALLMHDFRRGRPFILTLLAVLAFFPAWYCLMQGQDSILLVLIFALSFWLWRRGQDDAAGFVLSLGLFRPQLVLPFVLISFLGGQWRFVRGFIPGALSVVGLSTWVVGFHGMADYARILISQGTQGSATALAQQWQVWPQLMPTLRGLLWMLPSWVPINIRGFLLLLGTVTGLAWASKRMRCAVDGAAFDLAFAMAVAVVTLVSFHSFLHDFSLMVIPLMIAGSIVVSSVCPGEKSAYLIVTLGFFFFLTPLYPALLLNGRTGLLVLPTFAFLLVMSSWQRRIVALSTDEHLSAESVCLRAV
jgi:Glycosyltransferase family 87